MTLAKVIVKTKGLLHLMFMLTVKYSIFRISTMTSVHRQFLYITMNIIMVSCGVGTRHMSQSLGHSTCQGEWLSDFWPQRDLESILSAVCLHIKYWKSLCPWLRRCFVRLCCSVSHMAEDAVLHYSLSQWEGEDSTSSSSRIYETVWDVRNVLKLMQRGKKKNWLNRN